MSDDLEIRLDLSEKVVHIRSASRVGYSDAGANRKRSEVLRKRFNRVFRVLKLVQYLKEANLLINALRASLRKITVFLFTVLTMVVIFGSLMYVIEGEGNGFTSIPRSIYWAIVTMTTVGYGDISPVTSLGQTLASLIMIIGYGIIAVPTGIVSVEMSQAWKHKPVSTQACPECSAEGHDHDAKHCKYCGSKL